MLPHVFLPARVSSKRLLRHLSMCTPFDLNLPREANRQSRQHSSEHRLTEAVTRLVGDYRVRSANRLLQSNAEEHELTFDEKVSTLQKKILDRDVSPTSFTMQDVPVISPQEVNDASQCQSTHLRFIAG